MKVADVESSLFKYLYDNFEALLGIKIFESVFYVDFESFNRWIVLDTLSHSSGAVPRANFALHLSIKNGLLNDKVVLNRLIDTVMAKINAGARINCYDDATGALIGEMEVCESSLLPVMQHAGGGSFRTLTIGVVYAGEPGVILG